VLAVLVLVLGISVFGADLKVRVVASQANIRLKPDLQSAILSKVPLGGSLDAIKKEGDWYQIKLPPDEKGIVVIGYIHQSTVEIAEEIKDLGKEEKTLETKSKSIEQTIKRREKEQIEEEKLKNELAEEQKMKNEQPAPSPQINNEKKFAFRGGLGLTFPSGDIAELFGLGIGVSAGNSFTLVRKPMFDIDLLANFEGHIFFRESGYTDISWTRILLSGGSRFSFKLNPITVFGQVGLGLYMDILEIRTWWWTEEGSEIRFGPQIGGGIGFRNLEILALYHLVNDKMFSVMGLIIIKF